MLSNIPILPTVDELDSTTELTDVINKVNEIINKNPSHNKKAS